MMWYYFPLSLKLKLLSLKLKLLSLKLVPPSLSLVFSLLSPKFDIKLGSYVIRMLFSRVAQYLQQSAWEAFQTCIILLSCLGKTDLLTEGLTLYQMVWLGETTIEKFKAHPRFHFEIFIFKNEMRNMWPCSTL